jgi:hypothetical protein
MKSIQSILATRVSFGQRTLVPLPGGRRSMGVLWLALVALAVAGCQTSPYATSTGSAVASVTIARPLPEVTLATDTVFLKHGFTGGRTSPDEFTFTHPGSRTVQLANGGSYERVNERAIITLKPYGDTVTVTCNAQWVDSPGEVGPTKRSLAGQPYQDLLAEIEARLQ